MRLSMSHPTTPNTGRGGAMWGFALVVFTMPQGWGSDWHANPLHIPHLAPTGGHSPNREHCYMSLCPHTYVLLKNTIVSNVPPLGQQTACKSPRNPPPYPVLGVVGRDNDRRISDYSVYRPRLIQCKYYTDGQVVYMTMLKIAAESLCSDSSKLYYSNTEALGNNNANCLEQFCYFLHVKASTVERHVGSVNALYHPNMVQITLYAFFTCAISNKTAVNCFY